MDKKPTTAALRHTQQGIPPKCAARPVKKTAALQHEQNGVPPKIEKRPHPHG